MAESDTVSLEFRGMFSKWAEQIEFGTTAELTPWPTQATIWQALYIILQVHYQHQHLHPNKILFMLISPTQYVWVTPRAIPLYDPKMIYSKLSQRTRSHLQKKRRLHNTHKTCAQRKTLLRYDSYLMPCTYFFTIHWRNKDWQWHYNTFLYGSMGQFFISMSFVYICYLHSIQIYFRKKCV